MGTYKRAKPFTIDVPQLARKIREGDRGALAKGITLLESVSPTHRPHGEALLRELLPYSGGAKRIGITGVPGAGKSTFLEAFGLRLAEKDHRVAVLAVDPTSTRSGGSILGDKTRMELLAHHPNAFIRPSPTGGTLGGVQRRTREVTLLCEAAGFDVIFVETVGVGQSEVVARDLVDVFLYFVLTGAGDELQGMKKGIMELADVLIVHKADGENELKAARSKHAFERIVHDIQPVTEGWPPRVMTLSSQTGMGMEELEQTIDEFFTVTKESGVHEQVRKEQQRHWFHQALIQRLHDWLNEDAQLRELQTSMQVDVLKKEKTVPEAVDTLFQAFLQQVHTQIDKR